MKKFFWGMALMSAFMACQNKDKSQNTVNGDHYEINATTTVLPDSSMVILQRSLGRNNVENLDTSFVQNGEFSFTGKLDSPTRLYLDLNKNGQLGLFMGNDIVNIAVNDANIANAKVTGSKTHSEYESYQKAIEPFEKKKTLLDNEYYDAQQSNDINALNRINDLYDETVTDEQEVIKKWVNEHPESVISVVAIREQLIYNLDYQELNSLLNTLSPKVIANPLGQYLVQRKDVLAKVAIGKPAPDFTLNDTNGKPLSLSSLKGNPILIDFWASWCPPCRKENPHVVKLYNEYKSKGFQILGVSLDNNEAKWKKAIADDHLNWYQVSDLKGWKSEVAALYGVNSIPHTVLIDANGKIIAKNIHGEQLRAELEKLYPNK